MNILGIDIPAYDEADNLMKQAETSIIDWTISRKDVLALEKVFKGKCKGIKKKRSLIKNKRNNEDLTGNSVSKDDKSKVIKIEKKEETSKGVANGDTNAVDSVTCIENEILEINDVIKVENIVTNIESVKAICSSNKEIKSETLEQVCVNGSE